MRRLLDIVVAGTTLVIGAPLLAFLGVAVKLDTPGPALFFQTRVGRNRKPIRVAKLRTMITDAERSGAAITAARDSRITRVGALLRRTKLDELPQLWNVLRGDMSLVGPRPEVTRYVDRYRPEWLPLLRVRPGLTDLASLTFRDEERLLALAHDRERAYVEVIMPMKLGLALEGLARARLVDDATLIARTVISVLGRQDRRGIQIVEEARRRIESLNLLIGHS